MGEKGGHSNFTIRGMVPASVLEDSFLLDGVQQAGHSQAEQPLSQRLLET